MNPRLIGWAGAFCLAATITLTAAAQDSSTSQAAPSTAATAPKKIWTNDDVGDLRANSPMPPAGEQRGNSTPAGSGASAAPGRKDASWYHDQIEKLQKQLPPIEAKIADLEAAIDGKPTGDAKSSTRPRGVKGGSWQDELAQTHQKHDDIAARIAALRDQARHAGISDSALP
jgi:hypothetical protein